MKWRRVMNGVAAFLLLVVLQYTVRPLLGWRVSFDFLIIAVLLMAVRFRPGTAALLGFVIGLLTDSLDPSTFGAGALSFAAIAYAASWLKAIFFADNLALHASFFFLGKWSFDVLYVLTARRLTPSETLVQLLVWSPIAAVLTAIAGVLIMFLFRVSLEPQRP